MFHWCQNVNVYNVENHYHFYSDQYNKTPHLPDKAFEKLKVGPISVASGANPKHNSRSCSKKGLNLSKALERRKSPSPTTNTTRRKSDQKNQIYSSAIMCDQHGRSAKICQSDIVKTRSHESETPTYSLLNLPNMQPPSLYKTQRIQRKHKPAASIYENPGSRQQNNHMLTELYATKLRLGPSRSTHSNATHQPNQVGGWESKQVNSDFNMDTHGFDELSIKGIGNNQKLKQSEISIKSNIARELHASQMISSSERTQKEFNLSGSQQGYNNSKYNVSKSGSLPDQDNSNERFYFRIMQMSRGEAREASIILSNILSRSGRNSYSYCSNHKATHQDRRIIFEDKQTILSQNDALSEASLKIEQSELCEFDPHHNFTPIKSKTICFSNYTLDLAIENTMKCVVSLKEVGFREMSAISQELQMYQFLEQKLANTDTYHNVLELYQVQMTSGSYLLIKEPYTHSLVQYIQTLDEHHGPIFLNQFQQMAKGLLEQFAVNLMFPSRLLNVRDFVVCESVIKFHDLSVFKQMKAPIFSIEQLLKELEVEEKYGKGER